MTAYLRAWDSNDPDDISALFAPDAVYLTAPFAEPRAGIDTIVSGWLEDRDEPGDSPARTYSNLWMIRFAADGRAASFTEWYMRQGAASSPGSLG